MCQVGFGLSYGSLTLAYQSLPGSGITRGINRMSADGLPRD